MGLIRAITSMLAAIRAGIDLYFWFKQKQREAAIAKKDQEAKKALEDLAAAEKEEDIFEAQRRVTRNKF